LTKYFFADLDIAVGYGQTAAHVLETYRRGITKDGVPREMLTDRGRPAAHLLVRQDPVREGSEK